MNISPHNQDHRQLENDANEWLSEHGFMTAAAPYHETMEKRIKERLSRVYTPTALYIRTRADRIAVHDTLEFVFEYECKTSRAYKEGRCNIVIEAIPFCLHMLKSERDIRCLYVYRNRDAQPKPLELGFWAPSARAPMPDMKIVVPPRGRYGAGGWCWDWFGRHLPAVPLESRASTNGTDDPYVWIPYAWAAEQPHWQCLLLEELAIEEQLSGPTKQASLFEVLQ